MNQEIIIENQLEKGTQKFVKGYTPSNRLLKLFRSFAAAFGTRWTSPLLNEQVMSDTMRVWEKAISDISDDQLNYAIIQCSFNEEFVSIHSFRNYALNFKPIISSKKVESITSDDFMRIDRSRYTAYLETKYGKMIADKARDAFSEYEEAKTNGNINAYIEKVCRKVYSNAYINPLE